MKIWVLSATDPMPGEPLEVRFALWVDVPVADQPSFADPRATSQVPWATSTDLQNLRAGRVVELVRTLRWAEPPDPDELIELLKKFAAQELRGVLADKGLPAPAPPRLLTPGAVYDSTTGTWQVMA
jgi:hypothetical protein